MQIYHIARLLVFACYVVGIEGVLGCRACLCVLFEQQWFSLETRL